MNILYTLSRGNPGLFQGQYMQNSKEEGNRRRLQACLFLLHILGSSRKGQKTSDE